MCVAQVSFYWQSKVHEHSLLECRECSNSYCIIIIIIIIIIIYSECYILLQVT